MLAKRNAKLGLWKTLVDRQHRDATGDDANWRPRACDVGSLTATIDRLIWEKRMWIENVKENSIIREIVRIAGRDDRDAAGRRGLATGLAIVARARQLSVPDGFEETLTLHADERQLVEMMSGIDDLGDDLMAFVRDHGVTMPRYGA
jgi:hypothetical protein